MKEEKKKGGEERKRKEADREHVTSIIMNNVCMYSTRNVHVHKYM